MTTRNRNARENCDSDRMMDRAKMALELLKGQKGVLPQLVVAGSPY